MRSLSCVVLLLTLLFLGVLSSAQQTPATSVPNLVRYGGVLEIASEGAPQGTTQGVTFAIYKQQEGGAPVWMETQNVTPDATGHYSVLLGSSSSTGLPDDLFSQQEQRWLGVQVQGKPEQPRVLLVSVPYAMKAAEADRLAGHSASEFVTTDNLQSAVQQQLQQQGATASTAGVASAAGLTTRTGVSAPALSSPATNFVDTTTNQVVQVQQNGSGVALSASAPSSSGIVGTSNANAVPSIIAGVEGVSSLNASYGVYGRATSPSSTQPGIGVYGQSDSPNGIGMRGVALGTGLTIGLIGGASSTSGFAIDATETATSGNTAGMVARIYSPAGTGALILNSATGTITGPLISARTNAGVQFTVGGTGNINTLGSFTGAGTVSGTQLISTVATGTAPLQVASTSLVPNLNASLLGGSPASAFAAASGSPSYIQNGVATQTANFNISGSGIAGGTLSGNAVNTATTYQVLGSNIISWDSGDDLYVGFGAGQQTSCCTNTFIGNRAGYSSLGTTNTFVGREAGYSSSGRGNIFIGDSSGHSNGGDFNIGIGIGAGQSNATGYNNIFVGFNAGYNNTSGLNNIFLGHRAGLSNTTGSENTFYGNGAGGFNTSGQWNLFVGFGTGGNNTTGSSDIYVGNDGPTSGNEANTIRIGTQGNTLGQQNVAYIAGIVGAATNSGIPVFIDATGKLGTSGGSLGGVTSFNGRTGVVVPAANDYGFSLLGGTLQGSQLSGTYGNAVTLSNTSNVFYGNGANLTGITAGSGSPYYIQNGTSLQSGANFNISGIGSAGLLNSATTYEIGGTTVVSTGAAADKNLFLGVGAGYNTNTGYAGNTFTGYQAGWGNVYGSYNTATGFQAGLNCCLSSTATYNTFDGYQAGYSAHYGYGYQNTFSGAQAGYNNSAGSDNSFFGFQAGYNNVDAYANTFLGFQAGYSNLSGRDNTFSGVNAGMQNTSGSQNTFYGEVAGFANTTGSGNTAVGFGGGGAFSLGSYNTMIGEYAGYNGSTGSYNILIGYEAGAQDVGNDNIYIGNSGNGTDSYTVRIGFPYTTDPIICGQSNYTAPCGQKAAYIAGVYGSTSSGGVGVFVGPNGQLGTVLSSRRFKEQIRDMGDSTNSLMKLRPVTFLYKPEYDKGLRTLQYGLIAEEVAEVYPDLVAYEPGGKPYTVKYQYLTTMLLNEVQKQYHRAEAEAIVISKQQDRIEAQQQSMKTQEQKINDLEQRLSRLEALVEIPVKTSTLATTRDIGRTNGRSR